MCFWREADTSAMKLAPRCPSKSKRQKHLQFLREGCPGRIDFEKVKKGKGLGTCYSAAYETRTAALYNLGNGSRLA